MVLHVEDHLVHGDMPLEEHSARIIQNKACDQTQHQMAIIRIFTVDLTGVRGQEMLEGAEDLFNQMPTRPDPQQACGANLCSQAELIIP